MGTIRVKVSFYDSPEEAPNYISPEFKSASLEEIVRVGKGTVGGNATLDLIFVAPDGQKYVAMTTENLVRTALGI